MLLLLKAAESVARYVKDAKKPLRVFRIFFVVRKIVIPRSGVILYVQSGDVYAKRNAVISGIRSLTLFFFL